MPIRSRESPFFLGGLLVMFAVAAALIGGGGPARRAHGDAPLFRQFVPGVASDSADPAFASFCTGDVSSYLGQAGALRTVRNSIITGTKTGLVVFEFTNPCDSPIVPPVLDLSISGGGQVIDATAGGFPSVIGPGQRGFLTAMWYTPSLTVLPDPTVEVAGAPGKVWDDLIAGARALTVDASGNDANSPEFDAGSILPFGAGNRWSVVAHTGGKPPAWPPYLWLTGTCADGTLGIGRFFPDGYGYNPAETVFEGFTSWLDCQPERPSIVGPAIDDLWMEAAIGGPKNTVFLDDLSLDQTAPGAFRLAANVINTNTVPGRPSTYSFVLGKPGSPPFQFAVPGSEVWSPGLQGSIVINNIPGDVDDFTSASGQVSGTVAVPGRPVAGWELPPTIVWSDGTASGPYANLVVVPNADALKAALSADGFTYRTWRLYRDGVRFLRGSTIIPFATLAPALDEQLPLSDALDLDERIDELEAATRATETRFRAVPSAIPP